MVTLAGTATADTTKLSAADGWTKITTLPTAQDIANNYYVFVDNTRDLMLGVGKGVNQNTKWYSLGAYYQNAVEPTSADMNGKTWILESYSTGFSLRNLEYSASPMQTEWNASWKFNTNDIYGTPNEWTQVNFAYQPDGYWTLQNGKYPDSGYLGPWSDGNFTNGAECAANKSGSNIGHFQIYAISRDRFKQNLLDNASADNPVDLTPWYVSNATFDGNNRTGWNEDGSGGNNNTSIGCEVWHRSNFKIYQDLTVPNGKYKVSLQIAGTTGAGQVYGTSGSTTKTVTSSAAAGNNFQNTVLSMIQDRSFGKVLTDEIEVANGALQIGMKCETTDQWLVFDNFKLYCTGLDLSAYVGQLSALVSECNSFISSGVVPDACETAISNAVAQYNKTYGTAKEYSSAITALTEVFNTYRNDADLQSAYAAYYAFKAKAEGLMNGVDDGGTKTTFTNAISTATSNVEASTTAGAIETEKANVRSAALTFISATDGQFDITFLASQNYADWKKKDGSAAGEVTWAVTNRGEWTFAESYEENCATTGTVLYQTVSGLPAGYYQVGMYAMAAYTSGRGFASEATEGDAGRSFAFAGNLDDASSILRTGIPIPFKTAFDFSELTTLDVNVHLTTTGDLTFGVQKDMNGSNWHFAQIASIVYSNQPDLTNLKATRDALVSEAEGLLSGSADYLTAEQQTALQSAITAGNNADDFESLNTVTLTTLPNAINTAKQQVELVKQNRVGMLAALERFEKDYNLADGTDYSRQTMSADAWATLIAKVNAVNTALDDVSQATSYGTIKDALIAQMDATDASLRLFKSYKAMADGVCSVCSGITAADSEMDTDASEQAAIADYNTAFVDYATTQSDNFSVSAFLGANLDFSAAEGEALDTDNSNNIHAVSDWEVAYADADTWTVLQTKQSENTDALYMRKNWGSAATTLTVAKQKMLPVGKYTLSFKWNSNMENMTNRSQYKIGTEYVAIGKTTSGAEELTYNFEITGQPQPFDLVFSFQKTGTDNTPAQMVVDDIVLTYVPTVITLADNAENADAIRENAGKRGVVTLQGRTLIKDGSWNTLCLPFSMTAEQVTAQLAPAALMELDIESNAAYAHQTGLDGNTLYLNFKDATAIAAGKPYIIKWTGGGENIANPVFRSVTVINGSPAGVHSADRAVTFQGTYDPVSLTKDDPSNLYLGDGNTLYYPNVENFKVNAFRAYFHLSDPNATARFALNFGGETTGISLSASQSAVGNCQLFDLQGRPVGSSPLRKGIYISAGKTIIKK